MTTTTQPQASMHILKTSADPLVSQGARRATEETSGSAAPTKPSGDDTEVVPRARRRQFSNADKRRILDAVDRCSQPGEVGALLRREGVYSSSLSTWRRQREAAELAALAPQKRYRNPDNQFETWSGKGRQPKWVKAQLAAGRTLSDLEIT